MTSIKLKFRAHSNHNKKGVLYFQVIHQRIVKVLKTDYRIYEYEWDKSRGKIVTDHPFSADHSEEIKMIHDKVTLELHKLNLITKTLESTGKMYSANDIIGLYKDTTISRPTVFEYMLRQSEQMKTIGRVRTGETYQQALNSFKRFRKGVDLYFDMINSDLIKQYESYLRANCLSRNTTSFYMRITRCIYNRAVENDLTQHNNPFKGVYTGVDKTAKRAIALNEIKRIKGLDLTGLPDLDFARDIFLLSFYMRGMSFIDLAYLRKKDLANGFITYTRKKTGQKLKIRWEQSMQEIMDKYPDNPTQYLLPIITKQDGTERRQYLNKILFVNRKLKQIAQLAKIDVPLTMYVSRHSWASIAKAKNVPISVISEGLGHDKEETTRIYLTSIQTNQIDDVNRQILNEI